MSDDGADPITTRDDAKVDDVLDKAEDEVVASRKRFFRGFVVTQGAGAMAAAAITGLWITFWFEWTDQICGRADDLFRSVFFLHWWFIAFNLFVCVKHLAIGLFPDKLYSKHVIYVLLPLSVNIFQLIFMMPTFHAAYFKLDCFDEPRKKNIVLWILCLSGVCIMMEALLLLWVGLADAPNMNLNRNIHRPEEAFEIPGMPSFTQIESKGKSCLATYCETVKETYTDAVKSGLAAVQNCDVPMFSPIETHSATPEEPLYKPPGAFPESLAVSVTESVDLTYLAQVESVQYFCSGRLREILATALDWCRYLEEANHDVAGYKRGLLSVVDAALGFGSTVSLTNPLSGHLLNHLAASVRSRLVHVTVKMMRRGAGFDLANEFKKICYEISATHEKFSTMYRRRQAAQDWADGNQIARCKAVEYKTSVENYLLDASLSVVEAEYTTQFSYLRGRFVHVAARCSAKVTGRVLWIELTKRINGFSSKISEYCRKTTVDVKEFTSLASKWIEASIEEAIDESEAEGSIVISENSDNNNEPFACVLNEMDTPDPSERLPAEIAVDIARHVSNSISSVLLTDFPIEALPASSELESLRSFLRTSPPVANTIGTYLEALVEAVPCCLRSSLPALGVTVVEDAAEYDVVKSPGLWSGRNEALRAKDIVENTPELFEMVGGLDKKEIAMLHEVRSHVAELMLIDVLPVEKSFTLDAYGKVRRSSRRLRKGLRQIDKEIPPKWYDKNAIGLLAVVGGANVGFASSFDSIPRPGADMVTGTAQHIKDLLENFDTKITKLVGELDDALETALQKLSNMDECLNSMSNPLMMIASVLRAFPFMSKGFALLASSAVLTVSIVSFISFAQWYALIHSKYTDDESSERFTNTYGVMVWIQLFQVIQCLIMFIVVLIGGNKLEYQLSFKVLIAVLIMVSTAQLNVSSLFSFTLSQKYDAVLDLANQTYTDDPLCDAKFAFQTCSPTRTALITGRAFNLTSAV